MSWDEDDNEQPQQTAQQKKQAKVKAKRKVMDLLARRDHSVKELKKKLKEKNFAEDDIAEAIEFAQENRWLGNENTMAERMAASLHRKGKGIHYINHTLKEKGLPQVSPDREIELEKALRLVKNKYSDLENLSREEKAKIGRFLQARGFDSETVRKVIYEKL